MDPITVAAQFAAYTWFEGLNAGTPTVETEARRFARRNWRSFTPSAHRGLGRLLLRIAGAKGPGRGSSRKPRPGGRACRRRLAPVGAACP